MAKRKFYNDQIEKFSNNAKKQWSIINGIINRKKSATKINKFKFNGINISDKKCISNTFNEYFCNIASKLKDQIQVTPINNHQNFSSLSRIKYVNNSIFLEPCTQPEIFDLIKSLKNSSTSDYNVIVLKHVNAELSGLLTQILNASLDQGLFPDSLKLAKVIPIFKNGKKNDVSNYRPISLLSVFSKLYEKVMHSRILKFFNLNGCIYQRQYGFRPNHSCEHALLDAQSTIHNTLNKKQISHSY